MTKPLTVLKSVGPKLVPFFKTCAIFFVLYGNEPAACGIVYCILKCLPVISLILFILLDGMSLSESYYRYSRRILIGLIFSCFGDVFLVWKHKDMNFELGLLMFAVAQTEYARAFGWRPFNLYAGGTFAILGTAVYYFLSSSLDGIMSYLVALYITLICTMAWRAVARVQIFDDFRTWCKLCVLCSGAMFFVLSDLTIAVDKFCFDVPCAHQIIMLTYYAAQVFIALSVVDSQVDELLNSNQKKTDVL
ncbi:Hypothetical predicted protein, partial [Mytilus galloprovincialis]